MNCQFLVCRFQVHSSEFIDSKLCRFQLLSISSLLVRYVQFLSSSIKSLSFPDLSMPSEKTPFSKMKFQTFIILTIYAFPLAHFIQQFKFCSYKINETKEIIRDFWKLDCAQCLQQNSVFEDYDSWPPSKIYRIRFIDTYRLNLTSWVSF